MNLDVLRNINALEMLENAEIADRAPPLRRVYNVRQDAFEMSDMKFRRLFRLNKDLAANVIDIYDEIGRPPSRSSAIDNETKV